MTEKKMAALNFKQESLEAIKGKVVVVSGGASGIGAATVKLFQAASAKVVFGDLDIARGTALATELNTTSNPDRFHVAFTQLDVSNYESVLGFFQTALGLYGKVDMAVHCAAITEIPGWFPTGLNMQTVQTMPPTRIFDINLNGTFYFTHIALAATSEGRKGDRLDDKSIVLLSSVAGFKDSPGLPAYTATKHGVLGLMRSLRGYLIPNHGVRINVVCPWATETPMFGKLRATWVENELPLNTPEQVARVVAESAACPEHHGKAFYVAGGEAVDIEDGINKLESEWLDEKMASDLERGQAILGDGTQWS